MTIFKKKIGLVTLAAAAGAAVATIGTVLVVWGVPKLVFCSEDKKSERASLRDSCECRRCLKEDISVNHHQTEYHKRLEMKVVVGEDLETGQNRETKKSDVSGLTVAATGAALLSWGLLKLSVEEKQASSVLDIANVHLDPVQDKLVEGDKDDESSTTKTRQLPSLSATPSQSVCPSEVETIMNYDCSLPLQTSEKLDPVQDKLMKGNKDDESSTTKTRQLPSLSATPSQSICPSEVETVMNYDCSLPLHTSEKSPCYKLNFDGSDRQQNGKGGGVIVRDEAGVPIVAAAYNLSYLPSPVNIVVIEATALIEGLKLARKMEIGTLSIEGDSEQLINSILGKVKLRPTIRDLVQQIKIEMEKFKKARIGHVPRKDNAVADKLAKWGTEINEDVVWYGIEKLPVQVANLVERDIKSGCWVNLGIL